MSESRPHASQLPTKPNLRHLKDQAKDRLQSGEAPSLALALLQTARQYGFQSWPKLKAHVLAETLAGRVKEAINLDDLVEVRRLLSRHTQLRDTPIGYAGDGPLTWAAECRGPRQPSTGRLEIVEWLISTGSDVHEGGDAPLMRASLSGSRTSMMELLVSHGADVNGAWHGAYPVLFAPCETLDPTSLRWLLQHGADPNCGTASQWQSRGQPYPGTALDYVLGTYVRNKSALNESIKLLQGAGGISKYDEPGVLATICGDTEAVDELLRRDRSVLERKYLSLEIGTTAGRMLTLKGATLLHVAAEFGQAGVAQQMLDAGADVNATALIDENGIGGQTPIFHAATQNGDFGVAVVGLLLARGADLTVRCQLPGHYERLDEGFEGTVLDYARLFPDSGNQTVEALRRSVQSEGRQS
jgi:ankyrin repeat protein